jgi:hypothetical protein
VSRRSGGSVGRYPATEHGCHCPSPWRQSRVPDREDALTDAVKTSEREAALDRSSTDAQLEELPV